MALAVFAGAELHVRAVDPSPPPQLIASPLDHVFGPYARPEFCGDDRLFWRIRPNLDLASSSYADHTDGWGLRNWVTPRTKAPDARRVVCLGDSCTYGLGLPMGSSWPARLGELRPALDVVNAGVPGYSSYQGVVLADRYISRLAPDVIVIEYGVNDAMPWPTPVGDDWVYLTDRERAAHVEFVRRPWGSALVGWLAGRLLLPDPQRLPQSAAQSVLVAAESRVPPDEFAENVRSLAARAPRAILLAWVLRAELNEQGGAAEDVENAGARRLREYRGVQLRVADEDGHDIVDVRSLFVASGLTRDELFLDAVHVTAAGAQIVAEAVAALLR